MELSIVIPAKNEAAGLALILPELKVLYPAAEIIVVNDGSSDSTLEVTSAHNAITVTHPYSKGNGASIKSGLRAATKDIVVCMDADGQHQPKDIAKLLAKLNQGFDMVVGSRSKDAQAGIGRSLANRFYNKFASWMVGHQIDDLTSGFRAIRRKEFLEFISLLPNKFSYPTTITMSFFRAGYSVAYQTVDVQSRLTGTASHINLFKDGVRFLLIIFKVGTLFSPLKIFFPISMFLIHSGLSYYLYTYVTNGRFTNMGVVLFTSSISIFLMGLISEQVTALLYKKE